LLPRVADEDVRLLDLLPGAQHLPELVLHLSRLDLRGVAQQSVEETHMVFLG
jgi:hypothetical protein